MKDLGAIICKLQWRSYERFFCHNFQTPVHTKFPHNQSPECMQIVEYAPLSDFLHGGRFAGKCGPQITVVVSVLVSGQAIRWHHHNAVGNNVKLDGLALIGHHIRRAVRNELMRNKHPDRVEFRRCEHRQVLIAAVLVRVTTLATHRTFTVIVFPERIARTRISHKSNRVVTPNSWRGRESVH